MGLDKTDLEILSILIANSRLSLRKIAKKSGLSAATVMNRVNKLKKSNAIKKYTLELDYDSLGYEIQSIIEVNVLKGKLFEVEKKIAIHPNVSAVYDVTGNYDVLVIAKFKTRKALDGFLKKIQTYDFVTKTKTALILNIIKEEQIKV